MTKKKVSTGTHVLGTIQTKQVKKLQSLSQVKKHISKAIKQNGFHELGSFYYQFPGGKGFTGVICLSESHVAIHTWPELGLLTLDVYICNYSKDNSKGCKKVFEEIAKFFEPEKIKVKIIKR